MNSNEQMITCVTVNDPTKLTNYHVNRIQVNCCSSSNDTNGSISPTSTSSTVSSKLFCLDKNNQSKFYCSNLNQIKDNKFDLKNKSQKNLTDNEDDVNCKVQNSLKRKTDSKKSIYSEQSLQKQIHQFKERQQNQLKTYSSTSSSSSNSSRKFLSKNESEPLNSFNYSLNSNCSTTDTLITNSTLNNKAHTIKGSSDSQKNDSLKTENNFNSTQAQLNKNDMNNQINQKNTTDKICEKENNSNEIYLFSLKRPKDFVHYTHEIKFMKTPGCTFLTSFIIFITILVISLLLTICVYISVQAFDAQSLNERTFEGQMVSLNLSHFYLTNKINSYSEINKLLVKDFKNKFERLFNKTNLISKLKNVEIVNIKNNKTNLKIEEELNQNKSSSQNIKNDTVLKSFTNLINKNDDDASYLKRENHFENKIVNNSVKDLLEQNHSISFKFYFISNELDYNLSASNLYLLISSELIKLNESLFYDYQLDQNSLHIKEIFSEDNLDKAIQSLLNLIISNNSLITNTRRLKRLKFLKSIKLNHTFDEPFDYDTVINKTSINKSKYVCEDKKLKFCSFLPYKQVLYPNLVSHLNLIELEKEFIYFRQIIDSECFHYAKEYICLLLQPACPSIEKNSILPCTGLCENFLNSCSNWIPNQIRKRFTTCQQINDMKNQFLTEFSFLNNTKKKEVLILNNTSEENSNEVIKRSFSDLYRNNKNFININHNLIKNNLELSSNYTFIKDNDKNLNNKNNFTYISNGNLLDKTNLKNNFDKHNEHLKKNESFYLNVTAQKLYFLENNTFKNFETVNLSSKSINQQVNNNCFNLRNLEQLNLNSLA